MSSEDVAGRFVGVSVPRREDRRLLTGRGAYVDDVLLPGQLHATFVRSDTARGTIRSIEKDSAAAAPGVAAVFTIEDLDAGRMIGASHDLGIGRDPRIPDPLAREHVFHVGEPVAVVVADARSRAEDAAELVVVDIEHREPVIDPEEALADPSRFAGPDRPSPLLPTVTTDADGLDRIFADAEHVVTERVTQHRYLPVPMETRGIVAAWDPHGARLDVWVSTQGPHLVRDHLAAALGLRAAQVRVVARDVGGGFGQKLFVSREEVAIAVCSRLLGRPVRWIEDRIENLVAAPHARAERADVSLALDDEGHLLAASIAHVADHGAHGDPNLGIARLFSGPYRLPLVGGTSTTVRTNTTSRGSYRGPWMFETTAREIMVDVAARRLGVDPLELRRRNVVRASDLPHRVPMGVYQRVTPAETLDQAASMIDYDGFRREQAAMRAQDRHLGIGLSLYMEPTAHAAGPGATDAVTLRVDLDGTVQLVTGMHSQGHSIETTMTQVVADRLGVPMEAIIFVHGDTGAVPMGAPTGGSRNAVFGGGASIAAANGLREKILVVAAEMLEAAVGDLELVDGVVSVVGTPRRRLTLDEIARFAYLQPDRLPAGATPGLEVTERFTTDGGFVWSNAAHACSCEVDIRTGAITLLRFVVSEDCGTLINPRVVEGQIIGGVVQGIGGALFEHFVYSEDGTPLTTTFLDYLLPTAADVPTIEIGHIETPSSNPGGFKGMGEGGAIGAPAAVVNAVADALAPFGVTLTSQPVTPSRLMELLWNAEASR